MKTFSTLLLIFSISLSFAQKHIVYVDISDCSTSLPKVIDKIDALTDKIKKDDFLVFISNGSSPFICDTEKEVEIALEEIKNIPSPSAPDYSDIKTINQYFNKHDWFSGVNEKKRFLQQSCKFIFILNPKQTKMRSQIKYIVNRILLTNRLIASDGLMNNCNVSIYFNYNDKESKFSIYIDELKHKYEYYEIQTY